MISKQELDAREKYGFKAYTITTGGGLKFIDRENMETEKTPETVVEKAAADNFVCVECGAISFVSIVDKCDFCKKKVRKKKNAPKTLKIMNEQERESKRKLMNAINSTIIKVDLTPLPDSMPAVDKARSMQKLQKLKVKYQELRKELEDDLNARMAGK